MAAFHTIPHLLEFSDLIRAGDRWELRLDVGERYGCNHLAPYDALCWECQDATYKREDSK